MYKVNIFYIIHSPRVLKNKSNQNQRHLPPDSSKHECLCHLILRLKTVYLSTVCLPCKPNIVVNIRMISYLRRSRKSFHINKPDFFQIGEKRQNLTEYTE